MRTWPRTWPLATVVAVALHVGGPFGLARADEAPPPGPQQLPALNAPLKPQLKTTDTRGISIDTNADEDVELRGLPTSRLGNAPIRLSPQGPTRSVRTMPSQGNAGVSVDRTDMASGLEDMHGIAPAEPVLGNEGVYVAIPLPPGA